MIRYKTLSLTLIAGENLTNALAGLGEKDRTVKALWVKPPVAAGGYTAGFNLRAYKDQTQVVDFDCDNFGGQANAGVLTERDVEPRVEINLPLKAGEGFQVGFYSVAGVGAATIVMEYEEN